MGKIQLIAIVNGEQIPVIKECYLCKYLAVALLILHEVERVQEFLKV